MSVIGFGLALLRNYDPFQAPTHFKITDMLKKMDKTFNATGRDYGSVKGGPRTMDDIKEAALGSLELPCHRRDVVPGSVSTTTSAAPSSASFPTRRREGEISFCAYTPV